MPPIDPERLLRTLSPLLDTQSGAIKSSNEVDKLYGLMSKFSKKLVSKIIYINILKATPTDVLDLFMQRGGWDMICNWATEGLNYKNWPFLTVVTELLMLTPATVTRLKDNDLPKIIKSLAKECENEEMRTAASRVYDKWMGIAQHKEAPPTYVATDMESITVDNNMIGYEIHQAPVAASQIVENQVILEADPTSGAFDLTQYIDATDLNTLETDFNPDDFNSTVEEHLMDGAELVDDSTNTVIQEGQETLQHLVSPIKLQSTDSNKASLCVVIRDGKRFLLRLPPVGNNEAENVPLVPSAATKDAVAVPEKKPKSPGKPRMPSPGKPKMPSSGKPPLKAYEAKAKKANTAESVKGGKGIPNFYPSKDKGKDKEDKDKDKERERRQRSKEKESEKKKQHSVMSAARAAIEAKRRIEEEKQEKLRLKVKEQKRIRDQRKEEIAKKQKEIDDETLKALKLTAQPPTKIPKIPKKTPSFADMIAIPGASNNKEKEAKKVTTAAKTTKETEKEKETKAIKDEKDIKTEDSSAASRRSRPKVYVSGKSRSLGLLEEMEQSQNKVKGKEKDKVKEEEGDKDKDKEKDKETPPGSKGSKRPSLDSLESPAKKAKKETMKRVVGIQESSLFMDAINSATTTRATRSTKRRASTSETKEPAVTAPPPVTPPIKSPAAEEVKPVVFNFYRDTLGDNDETKPEESEEKPNEDRDDDGTDMPVDAFVPAEGEGLLKSVLVIHRPKNKPKKSVRWVEDSELKRFHYFEMDETERINVTRIARNFTEMKQIERSEERKVLKRSFGKDNMEEKIPWTTPKKILLVKAEPLHQRGEYSTEIQTQAEREQCILEVFYFSKIQIPDSPAEPDEGLIKTQDDPAFLKIIPFDDIPGVTQVETYVFPPPVVESRGNPGRPRPNSFPEPQRPPNPGFNMNYPPNQQMPSTVDPQIQAHMQAQYNLWSTLSQVPNSAVAAAAAGMTAAPGSDMWNQLAQAAAAQAQGLAALGNRMPNFPLNIPFGYPPPAGVPPPGFGANHPGMMQPPPAVNHVPPPVDQFGGHQNQNSRFNGPPPGRGGMGSRDNRSGRPNRWDDRGNYDDRRREGDRNSNDRDRDRGRGGGPRGAGDRGGRDRDFHRADRNRAGTPRTVLCKFFQQGCCKVGEDCDFLHPGINGPDRPTRFSSRFPSPPPSTQSGSSGKTDSPIKSIPPADDDNWDAPEPVVDDAARRNSNTSFDQPPSSPTDESHSITHPPRMIPVNEAT